LSLLWTDRSDASGTGYFNPRTDAYDYAILGIALNLAKDADAKTESETA
jgi:hypothetical protein